MFLHSDRKGNDCIRKLRCHCIQILHSDIYSVIVFAEVQEERFFTERGNFFDIDIEQKSTFDALGRNTIALWMWWF